MTGIVKMIIDIEKFKKDLSELLKKYNVHIGVDLQGDTRVVKTNFIVGSNTSNEDYILAEYASYIYPEDL
jgi:hypothetical protein